MCAGLAQVPQELLEAAAIDGARPWRVFREVTMPLLMPIFVILTSLSIIWDFQVFQQIWVMLDQRPTPDYYTMAIYAFHAVVPDQRVRARRLDRRRDGADHVRGDARLPAADAEDR